MARKAEMETITQTMNDPFTWFQTATPLTGMVEVNPIGHSAVDDELKEQAETGEVENGGKAESDVDDDDSSNQDGDPDVRNHAPSIRKKMR